MTLTNFMTIVVLKILDYLVFMQNFLKMLITSDVSKISKNVPPEFTFILNVISESRFPFA